MSKCMHLRPCLDNFWPLSAMLRWASFTMLRGIDNMALGCLGILHMRWSPRTCSAGLVYEHPVKLTFSSVRLPKACFDSGKHTNKSRQFAIRAPCKITPSWSTLVEGSAPSKRASPRQWQPPTLWGRGERTGIFCVFACETCGYGNKCEAAR